MYTSNLFEVPWRLHACPDADIMQAVPLASRRNPGALKGGVEGSVPLLQLPHMDVEVLRKLTRKKLRSLPELQQADPLERHEALLQAGLTPGQVSRIASTPISKLVLGTGIFGSCRGY